MTNDDSRFASRWITGLICSFPLSLLLGAVLSTYIGTKPGVFDGAFDNFAVDNLFKATFGGSFGSISFGQVLPTGIAEGDLAADLSAVGSLAGGGDLGVVDLVYVPEPQCLALLIVGFTFVMSRRNPF